MNSVDIKHVSGVTLFTYECEDNAIKKTVEEAVRQRVSLIGAFLTGVDLKGADLSNGDFRGANLSLSDLSGADLSEATFGGAYMYGTDLRMTDLSGTDLSGADLSEALFEGAEIYGETLTIAPICMGNLAYNVLITAAHMLIGCKWYTHETWAALDDYAIQCMDEGALDLWKQWKEPLLAVCAAYRARTI